jgi:hypothetical protein
MAPINMFGRADFLTPLEIPGAATPQPILLTTIRILITRGSRGATGSAGAQRGHNGAVRTPSRRRLISVELRENSMKQRFLEL